LLQGEEVAKLGRGRDYPYQLIHRIYPRICPDSGCAAAYSAAEVQDLAQHFNRMARQARVRGVQLSLNLHAWNNHQPDALSLLSLTDREAASARRQRLQELLLEQHRRLKTAQ
ncbi:MAG: hypothetical protein AAB262_09490, partial [Elusimicrobiota bacterium]